MEIFDSNIWVFAITQTCPEAETLVEETLCGHRTVAISPYIHQEVSNAIRRTRHGEKVDALEDQFNKLITKCEQISEPPQKLVERADVEGRREMNPVLVTARVLGCEPKDAPLVNFAHDFKCEDVIIRTNDEAFSQIDPEAHGLEYLSIEYVDC